MRTRSLRRYAVLGALGAGSGLGLLVAAWQGCNIYDPSLLLQEAGTDSGPPTKSCLAKWPLPPTHDDPADGGTYTGFVAMQTVDVGAPPDASGVVLDSSAPLPPIGFDLDNDCTCCSQTPGTMCPNGGSCQGTGVICDDHAGRDHVALRIFSVLPSASAAANAGLQGGQFSILLQISNYNGTLNDTSVTVALYVSNGLEGTQDGGTVTPHHDGTDLWTVDTHYLATTQTGGTVADGTHCNDGTMACQPIYVDNAAYVSDGVLVSRPSATLPLTFGYRANIGGALMKLNNAVVSGKLQRVEGQDGGFLWGLTSGSISGRWPSSQLLSNLATLPNPMVDGSYLCGTDPFTGTQVPGSTYGGIKAFICSLQDISLSESMDNTGATCDALSMSLGFTAEPAQIGSVYSVPQPPSGCVSEAGALWSDTCQ